MIKDNISRVGGSLREDYPLATVQYSKFNIPVPDKVSFIKFFNDANNAPGPSPCASQFMYIIKVGALPGPSRFMVPNVQSFFDVEGLMETVRTFDPADPTGKRAIYNVKYISMSWSDAPGRFNKTTTDLDTAWTWYADCIHYDLAVWEDYLKSNR